LKNMLPPSSCFSKLSVDFQWTTQCYILEDRTFQNHHCENLKTYTTMLMFVSFLASFTAAAIRLWPVTSVIVLQEKHWTWCSHSLLGGSDHWRSWIGRFCHHFPA
jgi:hypothetical protein